MSRQPYTFASSANLRSTPLTGLGVLRERMPRLSVIVVSGALAVSGTSSAEPTRLWEEPYVHESESTTSGEGGRLVENAGASTAQAAEATRKAIAELRRISGLTWEQLGALFEVSRRSVHFWASGKPLNAANEHRLLRVLDIIRESDRGDARSTRAALFEVTDGSTPFDLLVAQRFDDARALLGHGPGRRRAALAPLGPAAEATRTPLPPEELFDARHDRVHRDVGRARAARTVRSKRRGSDR